MKIKHLAWIIYSLFAISIVLIITLNRRVEGEFASKLDYYTNQYNPGVISIHKMKHQMLKLGELISKYEQNPLLKNDIIASRDSLVEENLLYKQLHKSARTPEEFKEIDRIISSISKTALIATSNRDRESIEEYRNSLFKHSLEFESLIRHFITEEFKNMNKFSDGINNLSNLLFTFVLTFILFSTFLVTIFTLKITKSITNPIKTLLKSISTLNSSSEYPNIDQSILDSKTEIGEIARSYQTILKQLKSSYSSNQTLSDLNEKLKRNEMELIESRKKFESLYNNAPLSYQSLDENGNFLDVNMVWLQTLGYERDEVIGNNFGSFLHDRWRPHFEKNFPAFKKRGYVSDVQFKIRCKDGSYKDISFEGCIGYYPDGKFKQTYCVFQDITKRKRAEEEVKKLSVAVEQSKSIITITDLKGVIEYVNPKFVEVTGFSSKEAVGKTHEILDPENQNLDQKKRLFEKIYLGKSWKGEFYNRKKNGEYYWETAHVSPIFDENNNLANIMKIAEDVTQQKRIEEELQKHDKLKSIGVLAGGIAHDFNNILTGVYGNISLYKMMITPEDEGYKIISDAEKSIDRAAKLTKQLLTFSKGGTPVTENLKIDEFLEELVRFDLTGSNVKPFINSEQSLWRIQADKGQIGQVFSNLIINADQAMPNGGNLEIELTNIMIDPDQFESLSSGPYVKINFKDSGVGIAKKDLKKIFDPYFTTKDSGNGLGLSVIYSIVVSHKGYISVESELGVGTTFTIYLPADISEERINEEIKRDSSMDETSTAKILIMDDEEMVRTLSTKIVERLGYSGYAVENGIALIDEYKRSLENGSPYDLLIMDLTIPGGMGGKEAISHIIKLNPNVKTIVSSGYSSGDIMSNYKDYGFTAILEKPYLLDRMKTVIKEVLSSK